MNINDSKRECPKCGAPIPTEAPQGLCPKCVMADAAADPEATLAGAGSDEIPSLERVAAAFPNLEVIELIGRGAMGFVYKARQPHIDRFVALKLLPDKLARDPQFAERFNREGRVLARLSHPNVVAVHDFGRSEHFYWLMMEYVDGVNLRQAMRAGKFSPAEALTIVPKICEALQYAHEQGILHRDIKPENILLDQKGRVKIADFGIAKLVGEDRPELTLTGTGAALGTPHYMAPEQLEHPEDIDQRADIYSLGVVLYEMLTGELPIGRFAPPSSKTPVSAGVDEVVFRALEKDRERRQRSAGEFKTQVQTAGQRDVSRSESPTGGDGRLCRPAVIGASLVGASLLGGLILAVWAGAEPHGLDAAKWLGLGLPTAFAALAGTILGWVGLSEIRRSPGARLGLPLAWFAAVTYPFGVPALGTVLVPSLTLFTPDTAPGPASRFLICLVVSALLSALVWLAVAAARWAANQPLGRHWSTKGWGITTAVLSLVLFLPGALRQPPSVRNQGPSPRVEIRRLSAASPLPAGTVELVALSQHPSDGTWWKPDGSAWTEAPFDNPGHSVTPNAEQKAVELILRLPGVTDPQAGIQVRISGSPGWSGGRAPIQYGQSQFHGFFIAALLPREADTTTVGVGVADGPWETLAEEDSRSEASVSLVRASKPISIKFLGAIKNKQGDTVLTVSHDIEDKEVRLVAVDGKGEEQRSLLVNQSRGYLTATFVNLPLDGIRKFRFQVRPYRWAEFDEVALAPLVPAAAVVPGTERLRAGFNVPRGQVATFELWRHDADGQHTQLPWMSGYVVAPDDESVRGELRLTPMVPTTITNLANLQWNLQIASEDGAQVGAGSAVLGPLRLRPGTRQPLPLPPPLPPHYSSEMMLTPANPEDPSELVQPVQTPLCIWVKYVSRPRNFRAERIIGSGTNWMEALAMRKAIEAQRPSDPTNAPAHARFTVTGVDLREGDGTRWLALEHLASTDPNWKAVCHAEATGFKGISRSYGGRKEGADAASARMERTEIQLPDGLAEEDARTLRDELAKALVAGPVDVESGRETSLFRLPIGDLGWLHVTVKLVPAPMAEGEEAQTRLARERLDGVRERQASGQATAGEVAKAECALALAEARGDAILVAEAKYQYTEAALEAARGQYASNGITQLEFLTAETAHTMAKVLLNEAVQARAHPDSNPEETAAAESAAAASRLQSALTRLEQVKTDIANKTLAADNLRVREAEAAVGVAKAATQGDRLGAARIRLEHARKVREHVEQLRESGRAEATDVEEAQLLELRAQAFVLALEQLQ